MNTRHQMGKLRAKPGVPTVSATAASGEPATNPKLTPAERMPDSRQNPSPSQNRGGAAAAAPPACSAARRLPASATTITPRIITARAPIRASPPGVSSFCGLNTASGPIEPNTLISPISKETPSAIPRLSIARPQKMPPTPQATPLATTAASTHQGTLR